jgi:hypothetical protein
MNYGIGIVPPHLMPKPVVALERVCKNCRHFDKDGGLYGSSGGCAHPGIPEGMALIVHKLSECGASSVGGKWGAK